MDVSKMVERSGGDEATAQRGKDIWRLMVRAGVWTLRGMVWAERFVQGGSRIVVVARSRFAEEDAFNRMIQIISSLYGLKRLFLLYCMSHVHSARLARLASH